MISVNEKLATLRGKMKENGVQAYIIPSSDPHMSEYLPEHWMVRSYFSGFTGSAGTLVVTETESGLWTDGRYFIQAANQLEDSEIRLFRMGVRDIPTYLEFIRSKLNDGDTVGFDGRLLSAASVKDMGQAFAERHLKLEMIDLIGDIWPNRPEMPATEVFLHDARYAGFTCREKLEQVRAALKRRKADGEVFTKLDCVAWLMNIRAGDISFNPLAVSYALVTESSALLFINTARISDGVMNVLEENGVTVKRYEEIDETLRKIDTEMTFIVDPSETNYSLYRILSQNPFVTVKEGSDIVTTLKGVKNDVEIQNIRQAHILDGCAMVDFCVQFEEKMERGETLTECTVCDMLRECRAKQPHNMGESFDTIAAFGSNAAMMHYSPRPDSCAVIREKGLLLIDSGGQYLEGTTDITRTFVMGSLTREEQEHYTYVLKAHIALASAVFLEGCTGGNLDILARQQVWKHGIDYRCGTGHGVGMFSGVHEGPQRLSIKGNTVFKKGMTITNEPGIYEEGHHGIRTENIMLVKEACCNDYGQFLKFEPLTYFPIDTGGLLTALMTREEIEWLNDYHALVYEKLSPNLHEKELKWLKRHTKPISS